jgi:hypothetical protein
MELMRHRILAQGLLGKAIDYALKRRQAIEKYLTN